MPFNPLTRGQNRDGTKCPLPRGVLVEITKTGPLEKLVWALIKDPDNEIKTIHNRTEEVTEQGSGHSAYGLLPPES